MTRGVRFVAWVRPAAMPDGLHVRGAGREIEIALTRLGPGDVIGIDSQEILRREPAPNSVGFSPNLFPFVEMRSPDLPWRLSPSVAPWLALVIQEAPSGTPLARGAGPLPILALAADQLPPTAELGLWCHAQVVGETTTPIAPLLGGGIARVISPRRLAPRTRYVACLVPCFEAGRLAGLGQIPTNPRAVAPAWTPGNAATLPVYDHWFFTTGERGDFEALARRLQPRVLVADDPPWTVDVAAPGDGAITGLFTSLVPRGHTDPWTGSARAGAAARLRTWLEAVAAAPAGAPVIGPPLYGGLAAGATHPEPGWLEDANLDPRRRAAAALGAEAVRRSQDDLVAEAWRQLGDVRRANRERDLAHLGAAITARWATKHLAVLAPEAAAVVAAPALARVRRGGRPLAREVAASVLPAPMLSPAFRRLAAVHGRASASMLAASVLRESVRRPPLGTTPATAPQLATASRLRALFVPPPTTPTLPARDPLPLPLGGRRPATVPPIGPRIPAVVSVAPTTIARRTAIAAGVIALRARAPRRVEVARPPALALADVASVAANALGAPQALARVHARMTLGDVAIDRVSTSPLVGEIDVEVPVVDLIRTIDSRYLVAGVTIPADSVGLLTPNAAFIEAALLGANHELVRELRWRGAAIDLRSTPLRRFFDVRGRTTRPPPDLPAVVTWSRASHLGAHLTSRDHTVILLRGELVRRFPDALIFAAHAKREDGVRKPSWAPTDSLEPVFRGVLTDDTVFVGFDRSPAVLRGTDGLGWYVVVAERPGGASFGLDETGPRSSFATWADLSWSDVAVPGPYVAAAERTPEPTTSRGWVWGRDAAHMAAITAQRPMRVAFHTQDLLPAEAP